ncbi:PREDICTED: THAP domain-containing protein 5 [Elephantulus edwardii]|uniref:THAP domain-containing protein 5 n=1 Tax=Elephantulus edwardii TaxID=28737 RepID=UPI0003F05810|nr:PREDICTED: THAP domain-containing protein 5 [Elephantulus edwardii]
MPRYCAAICCKNRRGRNNKDRKLSFYPFPLHDKERLGKWLKNMKRDSWVPSKYQFLCSDHFTPDSLDIRWGIRYLKQTAIPTIFSVPEDDQGKDPSQKKSQKTKLEDKNEVWLKAKAEESFVSNESKKTFVNTNVLSGCPELPDSSDLMKLPALKMESIQNNMLTLKMIKKDIEEPETTLETSVNQDTGTSFHTYFENIQSIPITMTTSDSENIQHSLDTQEVFEITTSHITNPNFTNNSVEIKSENPVLFNTITQTVKELNANKESVVAIFVPNENSRSPVNSFMPAQQKTVAVGDTGSEVSLYKDVDYGTEVLQIDHSYCRQDINKEHLWQKVSKLHSKITLLELQEQQTLGRLKSLETLIKQLKQENWLSEENVKIIEDHFTTYEVTML